MSREMKDSMLPSVGMIPQDWKNYRLKRILSLRKEKSYGTGSLLSVYLDRGVISYNESTGKQVHKPSEDLSNYQKVFVGDFVLNNQQAWRGSVGVSKYNGIISPAYFVYQVSQQCDPSYMNYALRDLSMVQQYELASRGVGSIQRNLYIPDFESIYIYLPSLSEQRQIVHFLDRKCSAIDTAIEKTKESIEKLEEYKKSVITKAVTKGLDPDAKMKDSGVEWIGEVPEGWEIKQLRMFYSRRANKNKGLLEKNLLSLSYGNIIRKNIDTKEGLLPESFEGYNIVEKGDIVIRGTDLQNDHKSLRTGLVTERGIITSAYMTLMPKNDINSEYYHYLLHCYDIEKVFYSMGGGLRQSLEYWNFIRTPVLEPSKKEQEEIVIYIKDKCSAIDALITKKQKAISKWEEYKKSLIYYAVTGKIDCRNEAV